MASTAAGTSKNAHGPLRDRAAERTEAEWETIYAARKARKEKHRARAAGVIDRRNPRCRRYWMVLSYEGGGFHGWQKQELADGPLRTVEGVLEERLRPVLAQRVKFWPAGRTDAGVSARGQVAQFDAVLPESTALTALTGAVNAALPPDVRCLSLALARKGSSTSACLWKRYVYRVEGEPAAVLAACRRVCQEARGSGEGGVGEDRAGGGEGGCGTVDVEAMRRAGALLEGRRDFASFQSKGGRSTTVRTLHRCDVRWCEGEGLAITLEGDGFLYNMARIVAGTLLQVGVGCRSASSVEQVLAAADRVAAGPTAPAAGLCLEHVEYERPWGGERGASRGEAAGQDDVVVDEAS